MFIELRRVIFFNSVFSKNTRREKTILLHLSRASICSPLSYHTVSITILVLYYRQESGPGLKQKELAMQSIGISNWTPSEGQGSS